MHLAMLRRPTVASDGSAHTERDEEAVSEYASSDAKPIAVSDGSSSNNVKIIILSVRDETSSGQHPQRRCDAKTTSAIDGSAFVYWG